MLNPSVNILFRRKHLRCDYFLPATHFKMVYDFLLHYGSGKNAFEDKPLNYTTIGEIQKNEINFSQHSYNYGFSNSESLVDNVLLNVKNRVKQSEHGDFIIKSGFSSENTPPSPFENEETTLSSRYWSTEPFQTKQFNDYIYFSLREGILKRIINNGMSISSWHFHRFLYLNVKTLETTNYFFC